MASKQHLSDSALFSDDLGLDESESRNESEEPEIQDEYEAYEGYDKSAEYEYPTESRTIEYETPASESNADALRQGALQQGQRGTKRPAPLPENTSQPGAEPSSYPPSTSNTDNKRRPTSHHGTPPTRDPQMPGRTSIYELLMDDAVPPRIPIPESLISGWDRRAPNRYSTGCPPEKPDSAADPPLGEQAQAQAQKQSQPPPRQDPRNRDEPGYSCGWPGCGKRIVDSWEMYAHLEYHMEIPEEFVLDGKLGVKCDCPHGISADLAEFVDHLRNAHSQSLVDCTSFDVKGAETATLDYILAYRRSSTDSQPLQPS